MLFKSCGMFVDFRDIEFIVEKKIVTMKWLTHWIPVLLFKLKLNNFKIH